MGSLKERLETAPLLLRAEYAVEYMPGFLRRQIS